MQIFPNIIQKFVDVATGKIQAPWIQYLQQFTQAPPNILSLNASDDSPFSYTAVEPGFVIITGGIITTLTLTRGTTTIVFLPTEKIIPVSIDDTVDLTFSGPPIMQFIPIYGQRTG